ncbi:hypothetical protein OJ253_3045 [Cryptosporidium canis]|uniref:Uncharacterized protein n=1 Tax=Cryptosporidium canis TaxID=195482 RepID=A0A9D5DEI4_9CRYT|nr:hypothetical protein OJ253_3045 [Cryptosporidium canis]
MKSNRIFQYPLRSSRVVWRSKAPNIAALLTNTLLPREGNYSPSHLCYNVYSSRIIDGEIESCVKSCVGVDIGVDPGPVLVQRYGAEENGLELLCLERFEGSEDFYWRRLLQIPSLLQGPIRDLKLQTSHDFCLSRTQGINIFVRSTGEVAVLNLTGCLEDGLSYTILLRSGVGELLGGFQDGDGAGQGYVDHEVSIYCMVSSLYDFFEFSLLLSDRRILRMQFKDGAFRREMELDLNGIYEFEGEVVQTMAYGGGPGSYLLGGKGLYMLQRGVEFGFVQGQADEAADPEEEEHFVLEHNRNSCASRVFKRGGDGGFKIQQGGGDRFAPKLEDTFGGVFDTIYRESG